MSSLLADGGTGKTALRYAQFIAMATAREITGEHVFLRSRVLVVSLEDDRNELRRRIAAVRNHYDIAPDELKGWLFYCTPKADNGKLMVTDKYGRPTRGQLANTIETIINKHNIDLVCLDPFVKSHSVGENDNNAIDDVAQVLTDIAAKYDIAVDAPHHTSKGIPDPGNANRGRGASSMKDAGRLIYTLTPMSEQEAERFNVPEEQRRRLIRVDSAKVNLLPPSASARWFKLVSVQLDNATDLYPNGDHIQTVEPWDPPHTWEGMDPSLQKRILIQIDAGLADGNRYTDGPNAKGREAWRVVLAQVPTKTQQQAKEMVKTWVEAGVLKVREYQNPTTRKLVNGLFLDAKKLSS
jgi:hypothetical protein